jgi:methionine-rich copper-binding protein CopC
MTLRRFLTRSVFYFALALAWASAADAHAFLDHAVPGVGSTVHAQPVQIRLWFSEQVEPAFSTIGVTNDKGQHVEEGHATVDPGNAAILQVALNPLPPGTYKVVWRVVSIDSHRTEGDYTFVIAP